MKKEKKKLDAEKIIYRIFVIFLLIGLVIYCVFGFKDILKNNGAISIFEFIEELQKEVDENLIVGEDAISENDEISLQEKLEEINLFSNNQFNLEAFETGDFDFESLTLSDGELGCFINLAGNFNKIVKFLKLNINKRESNIFQINSVIKLKIDELSDEIKSTLKGISFIYLNTTSYVEIIGNSLVINNSSCKINNLDEKYNNIAKSILDVVSVYLFENEEIIQNSLATYFIKSFIRYFNDLANTIFNLEHSIILFNKKI